MMNSVLSLPAASGMPSFGAVTRSAAEPHSSIPSWEIMAALERILSCTVFAKAHRMCRLLQFLVERRMSSAAQNFKEYIIGVEVFNRNPALYNPAEDPIVRVQVGRLRERLRTYYEADGRDAGVIFSIPSGSYAPEIHRAQGGNAVSGPSFMLAVKAVRSIASDPAVLCFAQGLSEELNDRLFHEFGRGIVPHTFSQDQPAAGAQQQPAARYWLEGSVRFENDLVRASFRLVDAWASSIAWSRQFDRHGPATLLLQAQLAAAVCVEMHAYSLQQAFPLKTP